MKRIFLVIFSMLLVFALVGCATKTTTKANTTTKEVVQDNNTVSEEKWNEIIKDYGFVKDAYSSFEMTFYISSPIDLNKPDTILKKDGLLFNLTHFVSDREYSVYLDYKDYATLNKVYDYQKYDIEKDNWYIFDAELSFAGMFDQLKFGTLLNYSDCTYSNGEYKGSYKDEDGLNREAVYKFENNRLVEYREYIENNELYYLFKIDNYDKVRISLPEAYHVYEMPYSELNKFFTYIKDSLILYKAIFEEGYVSYNNQITLEAIYLRTLDSSEAPKPFSQIKTEVKELFIDRYLSKYCDIKEETSSSEYVWIGSIKNTDNMILLVFNEEEPDLFTFSILNKQVFDVYNLISKIKQDYSEKTFKFDKTGFMVNDDVFTIKYNVTFSGEFNSVLESIKNKLDTYDNIEWTSSDSSSSYHYDFYEGNNLGLKLSVDPISESSCLVSIYISTAFNGEDACNILEYGFDNHLFN